MATVLHTVVETPRFLHDADLAGIDADACRVIVDAIAADPSQGDEVQGSGGVRKVRVAGRGRGNSGGYRVMVAYLADDVPAYLLAVLSKGDRANFGKDEIAAMKAVTAAIKQQWRERNRR
jgi:hypothetical protein